MKHSFFLQRIVKGFAVTALTMAASQSLAQTAGDIPLGLQATGVITEDWRPPEFNGATLPGMRVAGAETTGLLTALVPAELAGQTVCVRVSAAKDYYLGTQTFTVAGLWAGGPSAVPLETRYTAPPQDLPAVTSEDALTRVSVGPCEDGTTNLLLVSGWKTVAGLSTLSLYVNAVADDRVALEFPDDAMALACDPRPEESRSYTHLCPVDAAALGPGKHALNVLEFRVVQKNGQPEEVLHRLTEAQLWLAAP